MRRARWCSPRRLALLALGCTLSLVACEASRRPRPQPTSNAESGASSRARAPVRLVIIATNDLHGAVEAAPFRGGAGAAQAVSPAAADAAAPSSSGRSVVATPSGGAAVVDLRPGPLELLGGHLARLRQRHAGRVLLLDAGDLWQGTPVSNYSEGEAVVALYRALGYAAVAVGNHDLDFGPVGPDSVATRPGQDPRGALKARARQAAGAFPFLAANLVDADSGQPPRWENLEPSHIIERAGVRVGLVGVMTSETTVTTDRRNLAGLRVEDPARALAEHAARLRKAGAAVVIALAHLGGRCGLSDGPHDPHDVSRCDPREEIMGLTEQLEPGLVDLIVAGHTHAVIAHFLHGIPVIESGSRGELFGRVDLFVSRETGRALPELTRIYPPARLCSACPGHDGERARPDRSLSELLRPYQEQARARCGEPLFELERPLSHDSAEASELGAVVARAMLEAVEGAEVAIENGGGIRAGLGAGAISGCELLSALPFDNSLVSVELSGEELTVLVRILTSGAHGVAQLAGLEAKIDLGADGAITDDLDANGKRERWERNRLRALTLADGRPVEPTGRYHVVINDFVAGGGDNAGFVLERVERARIHPHPQLKLREVVGEHLGGQRAQER